MAASFLVLGLMLFLALGCAKSWHAAAHSVDRPADLTPPLKAPHNSSTSVVV
jgi:hypothetical protein